MTATALSSDTLELVSFHIGDMEVGIEVHKIQEINRDNDFIPVPHAPDAVRGVLNLRGEVVTTLDLRRLLGLPPAEITTESRNLVIAHQGERIALLVDRISDIVRVPTDQVEARPENFSDIEGKYFEGVCKLDGRLVAILHVEGTLSLEAIGLEDPETEG